jgi:hypothetical protein
MKRDLNQHLTRETGKKSKIKFDPDYKCNSTKDYPFRIAENRKMNFN